MKSNYSQAPNGNEYTLTLTVNASEAMNNTAIRCKYEALNGNMNNIIHTPTVNLFVIWVVYVYLVIYILRFQKLPAF